MTRNKTLSVVLAEENSKRCTIAQVQVTLTDMLASEYCAMVPPYHQVRKPVLTLRAFINCAKPISNIEATAHHLHAWRSAEVSPALSAGVTADGVIARPIRS